MNDLTSRLTDNQLKVLFAEMHASRVGKNQKGFSHVQQWDVRRFLIRVFGFGGYDTELVSIDCVREIQIPNGKDNNGNDRFRWTVVYRVHQRLTVKDAAGRPIATYDGVATGDAQNQPSLGDAHDGAAKEADSQSLKRAAVNLGDAFGLALYNGGTTNRVVIWSAAHPPKADVATGLTAVPDAPEDPPVLPEPEAVHAEPERATPAPAPALRPALARQAPSEAVARAVARAVADVPAESLTPADRDYLHEAHKAPDAATVRLIWQDAKNEGASPGYLAQIAEVGKAKRAAEQQPVEQQSTADDRVVDTEVMPSAEELAEAAEQELRQFAQQVGLPEIETDFEGAKGVPLTEATAAQIRGFLTELRGTAA